MLQPKFPSQLWKAKGPEPGASGEPHTERGPSPDKLRTQNFCDRVPTGLRPVAAHRFPGLSEAPRSPSANLLLDLAPPFLEASSALGLASILPFSVGLPGPCEIHYYVKLHGCGEVGLAGTERPLEMPPIPIRQKLSSPVAMERDGRCLPSPWQRAGTADRRIAGLGKSFCSLYCPAVLGSSASAAGSRVKSD